jgi:ZIP family zinc transporter
VAVIDRLIPSYENHELRETGDAAGPAQQACSGWVSSRRWPSASAIFRKGLVIFVGALEDPALGISLAVAIAIHNIPEASLLAPLLCDRQQRKAFGLSFLSGLAAGGALIGYLLLRVLSARRCQDRFS